jgi:hypothetical protein
MHVNVVSMASQSDQKPADTSATRMSAGGRPNTVIDRVCPDLGVAIVALCSLVALIGVPLFW